MRGGDGGKQRVGDVGVAVHCGGLVLEVHVAGQAPLLTDGLEVSPYIRNHVLPYLVVPGSVPHPHPQEGPVTSRLAEDNEEVKKKKQKREKILWRKTEKRRRRRRRGENLWRKTEKKRKEKKKRREKDRRLGKVFWGKTVRGRRRTEEKEKDTRKRRGNDRRRLRRRVGRRIRSSAPYLVSASPRTVFRIWSVGHFLSDVT